MSLLIIFWEFCTNLEFHNEVFQPKASNTTKEKSAKVDGNTTVLLFKGKDENEEEMQTVKKIF